MNKKELVSEKVVIKITPSTKRKLTIACKKEKVNISFFVRNLIESKLK